MIGTLLALSLLLSSLLSSSSLSQLSLRNSSLIAILSTSLSTNLSINQLEYSVVILWKCTLSKDWSTQSTISRANSIFCRKVGFVSIGEKGLLLLPPSIPCSYLNCLKSLSPLLKVALRNPTRKI